MEKGRLELPIAGVTCEIDKEKNKPICKVWWLASIDKWDKKTGGFVTITKTFTAEIPVEEYMKKTGKKLHEIEKELTDLLSDSVLIEE